MEVTILRSRAIDPAVNKIAESLSKHKYNVKLVVWDRQGNLSTKKNGSYKVIQFNLKAPYDKNIVLLYIPLWWIYVFFFLLRDKHDVIHACDLDTLIPAILAKKIKGGRLFYTIYDFYANNLPNGRFQIIRNWIRRSVSMIEKFGIGFTETLFLVDDCRYEEVAGAKIHRIAYIYNSPEDCFIGNKQTLSDNKTEINILYIGVLLKSRGLDLMIESIKDLENCRLTIGGIGPERAFIEESARGNKKIRYIGWLNTYQEVIEETTKADIIFRFSDPKIPKTKYESPNKLFEAMMCSKPIIVTDGSSMSNIVRREKCGLVVYYGDSDELKNAILLLKDNPNIRISLGENGRRSYEQKFSWKIMEERLLEQYKKYMK